GDPSYGSSAGSPDDAVFVDDSGNVRIVNTRPLLSLANTSNGQAITLEYNEVDDELRVQNRAAYGNTFESTVAVFEAGGNVGIGTTDPGAKLDIYRSHSGIYNLIGARISIDNDEAASGRTMDGLVVNVDDTATGWGSMTLDGIKSTVTASDNTGVTTVGIKSTATGGETNWAFYGTGDGYFSGKIGIGTTSPDAKLHVREQAASTGVKLIIQSDESSSYLDIKADQDITGSGTADAAVRFAQGATWEWYIGVDTSELDRLKIGYNTGSVGANVALTIHQDGDVGIGCVGGGSSFDVAKSARFNTNGDNNDFVIEGISNPNLFYVDASRDGIAIGAATPGVGYVLDVTGDVEINGDVDVTGTYTVTCYKLNVGAGGVDPPFISFSNETHESIRQSAQNVADHEKVMQFWNGEARRIEIYVISEDTFYTLDGKLIKENK
ncbi:MAG: hypothetical protein KAJ51_05650, partial [Thermoplasmata archaeon]|nr:hypothetical protein [Thermoplasmata archaeon]